MKTILFIFLFIVSVGCMAQTLNYENTKQFIGERVNEFEEFYKVKSSNTEDNFGNLKVFYNHVKIEDYTLNILLETKGKNITKITIEDSEEKTKFFKNFATDIQKSTPEKKNYKTFFVALVRNKTKKKIFYESVNELIEILKNPATDLSQNYALAESQTLNSTVTLDDKKSVFVIN